ncbi:hypothetical protein GBAR_LOCUS29938, partial [Geodia barretti]
MRRKKTMKGLFSISHFKVTSKQSTLPHSRDTRDISLEQLSTGESLAVGELSSEKDEVKTHFQSHSDSLSQQPATVQPIPYLSYLADEEVEEKEEEEADPVPKPSGKFMQDQYSA